jgi:hypothetical protein
MAVGAPLIVCLAVISLFSAPTARGAYLDSCHGTGVLKTDSSSAGTLCRYRGWRHLYRRRELLR